eukprot:8988766-Alexandrium_andersonii.AAC.1
MAAPTTLQHAAQDCRGSASSCSSQLMRPSCLLCNAYLLCWPLTWRQQLSSPERQAACGGAA